MQMKSLAGTASIPLPTSSVLDRLPNLQIGGSGVKIGT